jgi:hypothetical protein
MEKYYFFIERVKVPNNKNTTPKKSVKQTTGTKNSQSKDNLYNVPSSPNLKWKDGTGSELGRGRRFAPNPHSDHVESSQ